MQDRTRLFPFLRYEDAPAAFEWLHRAFGFEKQMLVPGPKGTIAHAQLRYGASVVMIGTAEDDFMNMKSPKAVGAVTQGIYVQVAQQLLRDPVMVQDAVLVAHAELQAEGALARLTRPE